MKDFPTPSPALTDPLATVPYSFVHSFFHSPNTEELGAGDSSGLREWTVSCQIPSKAIRITCSLGKAECKGEGHLHRASGRPFKAGPSSEPSGCLQCLEVGARMNGFRWVIQGIP